MKRFGILALLLVLGSALLSAQPYAQNLFISEYLEGSSNNKAIELFNGTGAPVDLSQYSVKLGSNGGVWSTSNFHNPTGTLAHGEVYVIANSQAIPAILAVSDATSTVTYFNGDDCVALFQGDTIIDIIGVYMTDPGVAWPVAGIADATLNHTLIRKPTVTVGNTDWLDSAGTNTDDSEWIVEAIDYIADLGTHTFTPGGTNDVAMPVFNPNGGTFTSPVSVTITCSTPNSSIFCTTDGSTPTPSSTPYIAPITIGANITLKAMATAPGMDNSNVATAIYSFPVSVANLTALRAQPADGTTIYHVSGEAVLTFQQVFRHQKYLQDAAAGILIDDLAGVINTTYNVGDGITGITGKISEFGGMLQFVPTSNAAPASSTSNPIVPVTVNFDQLVNSFNTYESRVVKVMGVSFTESGGNFADGALYECYDQDTDYNIRTTFYGVDYIGTIIPGGIKDITGIPNSRVDGEYLTPRFLSDFADPAGAVAAPTFNPAGGSFINPVSVTISSVTPGVDIYYTTDGSTPTANSEYYEDPVILTATTTLKAIATINGQFSGVSSAQYLFPANVANLSALRQSPLNGLYRVTGQTVVSFTQSYRNQIFIQDSGAGILIDDLNDVISSAYQATDGISNLVGTLTEFGGMMQLIPVLDPGPPSSIGNQITPIVLTLVQFNAGFETYESRLVKIMDVLFFNPSGDFANGIAYPIEDASGDNTANFSTNFYDVNYIGLSVYADLVNITGIPNSRADGAYITARDCLDFQLSEVKAPYLEGVYLPEYPNTIYLFADFLPFHYYNLPEGLTGFRLYRNGVLHMEHGPAVEAEWADNLSPGTYVYHVTAMFGAVESDPSNTFTHIITSNPETPPLLPETTLLGNYPNPFNPSTTISFALREAAPVRIDIFNPKGQLLLTLLEAGLPAGNHTVNWDGKDKSGNVSGSGLYLYRMQSGSYTSTRKMLMLK